MSIATRYCTVSHDVKKRSEMWSLVVLWYINGHIPSQTHADTTGSRQYHRSHILPIAKGLKVGKSIVYLWVGTCQGDCAFNLNGALCPSRAISG